MGSYSGVDWFLRRCHKDQFLTLFLLNVLISDLGREKKEKKENEIITEKLQGGKKIMY